MRPTILLLALCFTTPALAQTAGEGSVATTEPAPPPEATPEAAAELNQLSDELARLAKRQVWSGAEKKYRQMEALGFALELEDYVYGAYAARELGDVAAAYVRLQSAARMGGNKEIVDWLWDIDHNYGHVELVQVPNRAADLACDEMPLDPNQRKAIEAAQRSAKSDGIYQGMLPRGTYNFAGQPFSVEPGVSVRIEVSQKVRRKGGPIDPVYRWPDAPPTQNTPPAAPPPQPDSPPADPQE